MTTTSFSRGSAKIYQFPVRGRMTAGEPREKAKSAADLALQRACEAACDSGWYHEDAIRESEPARKS